MGDSLPSGKQPGPRLDRASLAALFFVGLLAAVLRNPGALFAPPMAFEDGAVLFQHYYGGAGLSELFVFYAGYVSVLPDLVGFAASRLPTPAIPVALGIFPLCLTAFVPVETARVLVRLGLERPHALGIGAAMIALPLGSAAIESSTIYAYCHLLFLVVLWSIAHLRSGAETGRAWWWLAPLCMASHPLSVAVVPVYVLGWWQQRSREASLRVGYVSILAGCYVMFGMRPEAPAALDFAVLGAALSTWLGRVWFEVFLGGLARAELWNLAPSVVWMVGTALAAAVAAGVLRAPRELRTPLAVGSATPRCSHCSSWWRAGVPPPRRSRTSFTADGTCTSSNYS